MAIPQRQISGGVQRTRRLLTANRFPLCRKPLQTMEAKAWPPGKFRHVTEFGEAFEQTPARAILQFGPADGRRGRDGINGESGRARSRGSQAATCPVAMLES